MPVECSAMSAIHFVDADSAVIESEREQVTIGRESQRVNGKVLRGFDDAPAFQQNGIIAAAQRPCNQPLVVGCPADAADGRAEAGEVALRAPRWIPYLHALIYAAGSQQEAVGSPGRRQHRALVARVGCAGLSVCR